MFSITVALANTQIVWTLMFKTKESAQAAWDAAPDPNTNVRQLADDFGQIAAFEHRNIAGVLFEDLDQSKMAHIERSLHVERVKVAAQRAAQSDPVLKTAMMTRGNGLGIHNPVS